MSEVKEEILNILKSAERDLSMREIARRSSYSRKTIEKHIPSLGGEGKVKCTRTVGRAKMYEPTHE